jgi:hypothetical protein
MHANQKSTPRRAKHPKQPGKWRSHKKNGVAAAPKRTKNNLRVQATLKGSTFRTK